MTRLSTTLLVTEDGRRPKALIQEEVLMLQFGTRSCNVMEGGGKRKLDWLQQSLNIVGKTTIAFFLRLLRSITFDYDTL